MPGADSPPADLEHVRADLQAIYDGGIRSVAICFLHSFTFPDHEKAVAALAEEIGFPQISVSSTLSPQIKAVPRATSASVDAYAAFARRAFPSPSVLAVADPAVLDR